MIELHRIILEWNSHTRIISILIQDDTMKLLINCQLFYLLIDILLDNEYVTYSRTASLAAVSEKIDPGKSSPFLCRRTSLSWRKILTAPVINVKQSLFPFLQCWLFEIVGGDRMVKYPRFQYPNPGMQATADKTRDVDPGTEAAALGRSPEFSG